MVYAVESMAKRHTITISIRSSRMLRDELFKLARKAQRTPSDYLRLKLWEVVQRETAVPKAKADGIR